METKVEFTILLNLENILNILSLLTIFHRGILQLTNY
jgi:hypothetical protein